MPKIKLTSEQVRNIRFGYHEDGLTLGDLAALYNVSRTQIWRIVNNQQRHMEDSQLTRESGSDFRVNESGWMEFIKFLKKKGVL